jgi:lipoprotein-anchoring transpeptidase ErfK/SrfK
MGLLYYPNYIYGGVAIHGSPSVPATPASHGCIRIPIFAAKEFFDMATLGMPVLIYDSNQNK